MSGRRRWLGRWRRWRFGWLFGLGGGRRLLGRLRGLSTWLCSLDKGGWGVQIMKYLNRRDRYTSEYVSSRM